MFGLFKKRKTEPLPVASQIQQFQTFFATRWVQTALASSVAGFSGAALCGEGTQMISSAWKKMWASNFPNDPIPASDGLAVSQFHERGHLLVVITFSPPQSVGGIYFGIAVIGPCEDPEWRPDARQNLPFRYFVHSQATQGTSVEEWTTGSPVALGAGPEADLPLFAEWVLNHAVRATADVTVTIRKASAELVAAIERARRELPAVLQRFMSGELRDANFTVKVAVKHDGDTEHFWLSETTYANGRFSGIINADPQIASSVKRGDRWTAPMEDVTDWMYARNQKMYGNYTLRALMPTMPPDEAAKFRAILADEED